MPQPSITANIWCHGRQTELPSPFTATLPSVNSCQLTAIPRSNLSTITIWSTQAAHLQRSGIFKWTTNSISPIRPWCTLSPCTTTIMLSIDFFAQLFTTAQVSVLQFHRLKYFHEKITRRARCYPERTVLASLCRCDVVFFYLFTVIFAYRTGLFFFYGRIVTVPPNALFST